MIKKIKLMEPEEALELRAKFEAIPFEDGSATAGSYARDVKKNRQITGKNKAEQELLLTVSRLLFANNAVRVFAYPKEMCKIMTNIHGEGEFYGKHVDNVLVGNPAAGRTARADMSFTLFLTDPSSYEGGELQIETDSQIVNAKGNPGEVILYDSGLLHQVLPVTKGMRISTVGWIQSWVPDYLMRASLSELDIAIGNLGKLDVDRSLKDSFHKVYNSFLRLGMR